MNNFSTSSRLFSRSFTLVLRGQLYDLSSPAIMGILNATPDSFYKGSRIPEPGMAVDKAGAMFREGAIIVDVGAASSRPGAEEIPVQEEIDRLGPVLEALRKAFPDGAISVDTYHSSVAKKMHELYDIDMVNDISAGEMDPHMFSTMASLNIPYVIMHMQGNPKSMQDNTEYDSLSDELLRFFGEKAGKLKKLGVKDIIIDPGFGFGKTLEQNYELLRELDVFAIIELPIMVGISRKSMIYKTLEQDPSRALNGTSAAHMIALLNGARILRVHDVKEAMECIKIFQNTLA